MISRIFIIFLITATVKCSNYDRVPRIVKNNTVDYRVSLRQILRSPEVNRPPFNLFKSREEFVKLAEQNIKNHKPYNYKLYRPYNPSKPAFFYDRDYVIKVLSSLGLLRPLQNVPSNPQNTSESVITAGTENLNIKLNSSTDSPKPVNNSFVTSESNGIETTTTGNSNEDINTTTNSYTEQTTNAAVSITKDAEGTTELTTESFGFSTYTTEGTNIPNYSITKSVTDSTTTSNTEETIITTTDSYTTLTPSTKDSSTVDEGTIVQSSTDSFGIANTSDILSYFSTEPTANAETQYTTEISTTERIEPENENLLLTGSNRVETTTISNTQHGCNPTTPDVAAFITQFEHVPTSIAEDAQRTTELTTDSFGFSTYTYYSTTESVTDSSTVDEGTIVQSSMDSFGIANTTYILSYSSTEPAANAETQYTAEVPTTERLGPQNGYLVFTGSNLVETTTTNNDFNPTTIDVTASITQFGNSTTSIAEDTDSTTEKIVESFGFPTNTAQGTNILNYFTTESVTESNRIESTTDANTEESIYTTTDSYTTLAPNAENSSTANEETITQFSTASFGTAAITDIVSFSSTEPATNSETQYTTEISTDCIEPENENLLLTGSNRVETITTSNTQDGFNPTTPDIAAFITQFGHVPTSIAEDAERTTELTTDSFGFSTYTYYSTTESVTESNRINQTTTDANTEDSSTVDEGTIAQSSMDSFGIANTTYILSYSSTEPAANAETQYTTEVPTTERLEPQNGYLVFTGSNLVETTTTNNDFNPTTIDVTASITQFGNSPTSIAKDTDSTTEIIVESFGFPTNTAQGTNILNYFTTESVTESNRIESTTDYTTLAPNAENSSTANEETITQFSSASFGTAAITDILSFSSTEPATNSETQYTTEISTDCIEPENENLVYKDANRVETITTSKAEDVDLTSTDATAPITQFGNSEDVEGTAALTTESFGSPTNAVDVINIFNYSTSESVTESNRINQTTAHAYAEETILTTTNSYTTLTPNAEASLTVDEETIVQSSTKSVGIATTASYSSTEPLASAETVYATEISTTDCMEPENDNLVFTNSNRVETTTSSNTEEDLSPTTDSYTEQATDAAAFKTTTENVSTLNTLDVEKTTELTTPSVWTTTDIFDGTDIPNYSTKEPVRSPDTTILSLETDNAYFMFTESNQIETATDTNSEQNIPTTTDSSTEQTIDSSTTLAPNLTEEPITELTMESWDIEMTTKTDILKYSTTESVIFTSTVNPNDTMIPTIESLTTETNQMETITTTNDIHMTTSDCEEQTTTNPTKTTHEIQNYTTFGVMDLKSTTLGFDIEPTTQICEETTESEHFPETIVQSETVTAEQFKNVASTTEATEVSIDVTTELNENAIVNIPNGNTTEQEPIVFSTTDNFNVEDSIGTTIQISKEIESLPDLLQPTTESSNEVSTPVFDSTSIKDITESTTNVMLELWNMSTTPLLEDITTEMYEVISTSALMDNSITQNVLLSTITELPTLSTTKGNDEITTEISQIECTTEIIEQVEETTIEAEVAGEAFEKPTTELMLTEISSMETATEQILKNITENNKGNATSRVLLTDDTTASETVDNFLETYNEIIPETFEQSTNQFMTATFQEYTTKVMDVNKTEFYKENTIKQIASTTPISLVDNLTTTIPIVTTERLYNIKSNTVDNKSNEETSVTPSNHLENMYPSIEPLYNRQQKLAIKNLKESSKRKAKKFNYDTDVMPSLGDYDYI